MKVLFASRYYAPAPGGAEISMHTLLRGLSRRGFRVRVLTDRNMEPRVSGWPGLGGVSVAFCAEHSLEQRLTDIARESPPDVVMTQSPWADRVLSWAGAAAVPSLRFLRTLSADTDYSLSAPTTPTRLVANSPVTADFARTLWGRNPMTLYPLIDPHDVLTTVSADARCIGMINPVQPKGGDIFRQVARLLPDRDFLAVRGWTHHGAQAGSSEAEPANVRVIGPVTDMRRVYERMRLLLVPSIWTETFGRVAVEAMMNGIPIIISSSGALPWVAGEAGTVVNSRDPQEWKQAVERYDDPRFYTRMSEAGVKRADEFHCESLIDAFAARLREEDDRGWGAE